MHDIKTWINDKMPRKNGEAAIYLVVHLNYKSMKFNTGVTCLPSNWDYNKGKIKGNGSAIKDKNLIINECIARMNEIFVRCRLQNITINPELLKNEWKNPSRRIDFFAFFKEALIERKNDLAYGTYKHHKTVLNFLKKYKKKLAFSEITPDFIEKFERWLRDKENNDVNTIHSKLRIFRTYLNIAVRKGIIEENPFTKVKLKKAQVNRIYLSDSELKQLWKFYESQKLTTAKQKVLRHFLFMCFTGLRISDLRAITPDNIIDHTLIYNALKTKKVKRNFIKVPLSSFAFKLIKDEQSLNGKLFNTISEQKMNKYIKEIVLKAGINKEVTNHSGRHTFATLWLEKTNDLAQLQALLGHSNISDTMVYVHITDSGLKSQMKVFEESFFGNTKDSS
jgi:integrase/recombinase XerD